MRWYVAFAFLFGAVLVYSQAYELKDHRPKPVKEQLFYDSIEVMCDSFFIQFKTEDITGLKEFVPNYKHLKATFDTLDIEYNLNKVVVRQQMLLRNLQKQYGKILRKAKKRKLKLKSLTYIRAKYEFVQDEKGNEFCLVTMHCNKRKHNYEIRFIAIKLNDKWFVGDKLEFENS